MTHVYCAVGTQAKILQVNDQAMSARPEIS